MISGKIKVSASVISQGRRPRLITLAETLIIPDITKTEYYSYCFMENIQKLLCEMQVDFICALLVLYKDKRTKKPHQSQTFTCSRSLAKGA